MAHDILIVDDEKDIRVLTSGILQDEGFQTREAATSAQALSAVETRRPSLVLLDIWLQGSDLDGLGILKVLRKEHPTIPVLMMSGHGTVETAVTAIKDGAYDFIEKPFKADRLLRLVERAIETDRLRRDNAELRMRAGTVSELIGDSPAIREVKRLIARVAPTNSRVLITGPAGSGKEVAARMLHAKSRRSAGSFVVVNCATMLPERMEIELFGAENSGDGEDAPMKVGTFEAAHNGTLFLDGVGDMPLETQGKIVRVLQEQIFKRIGGSVAVEVDVRVIAASTADLSAGIAAGSFRQDLFYRLNVVPIEIPPLSARPEDIPVLTGHFMERTARVSGQPPRDIGADAMALLQAYKWPGNVRELCNTIERLLIMAPEDHGQPIGAAMLPPEIQGKSPPARDLDGNVQIMGLPLRDAREVFEREYLLAQVTRFGGNISRTAEFVGMERSALHRKLKSLGVRGDDRH